MWQQNIKFITLENSTKYCTVWLTILRHNSCCAETKIASIFSTLSVAVFACYHELNLFRLITKIFYKNTKFNSVSRLKLLFRKYKTVPSCESVRFMQRKTDISWNKREFKLTSADSTLTLNNYY